MQLGFKVDLSEFVYISIAASVQNVFQAYKISKKCCKAYQPVEIKRGFKEPVSGCRTSSTSRFCDSLECSKECLLHYV